MKLLPTLPFLAGCVLAPDPPITESTLAAHATISSVGKGGSKPFVSWGRPKFLR